MGVKLKRFLHKFFKIFIIFMLVTLAINLIILAALYGNHKSKMKKESVYMYEPGEMVEIDGHKVHLYESGNLDSEKTIVFLHGGLSVDDSIALQPLFAELSEYHLVYIDRTGYGFSLSAGVEKDIDSILEETRSVLKKAGISGPYILAASGSAGVEAVYWAHTYKDEVEAIIGMDMNYPEQFESTTTEDYAGFFDYMMVKFCSIGGMRLMKNSMPNDIRGIYTEMQMATRNALVAQRAYTQDMFEENESTVENAAKVNALGWPEEMPMLMLLANPIMEPYINDDESVKKTFDKILDDADEYDYVSMYNQMSKEYYAQFKNVTVEELSGPSRLYTYCPKEVAERIKAYIGDNLNKD
ncbi:MAG: alpha/beta hydrolase [Coprococcus sp.]|nr:alpha/beta hydrolase [Coprococcus sp.]